MLLKSQEDMYILIAAVTGKNINHLDEYIISSTVDIMYFHILIIYHFFYKRTTDVAC